ncbi:DUF1028 domain-containing protein [Aureitalea marina]|uniref:Secretion system C-terminal sorting domain-containing protein n=1 Tax=Aureitalea marina TaxID=930804 RepID=A0A2S7KPT4_9FLAO|nr:DUF1028 domain-containing protein [Aureitalea marina]PQB04639.1 hypothetical protein BST85_06820 [Aureitalea marina]
MKRILLLSFTLFTVLGLRAQDTFSIIAVDPETGEVGSAGASCVQGIGDVDLSDIISDIIPGRGGINAQALVCVPNPNLDSGIDLMDGGASPQEVIDFLLANDACGAGGPQDRQYGVVDFDTEGNPRSAGFTGSQNQAYAEDRQGPTYSIQGNILLDQSVLDNMEDNFNNTEGTLADRLMSALQGANFAGADSRCLEEGTSSTVAYIMVYKEDDAPGNPYLKLNVGELPAGEEPIDALQELYDAFLGTDNIALSQNIGLSPNPVTDRLNIMTVDGIRVDQVSVFDISGKQLMQINNSGSSQIYLDTASLPAGVYFARILTDQGSLTKRFIKQ